MLTIVEGRVLGCLIEKERTVADQYPLTMNTLVSACNQSTSREPVMHLGEPEVLDALTAMKAEGFARVVHPSHGRSVTRYRHTADEKLVIEMPAAAVIAVLLLRGPQTVSELRSRTERQHPFDGLAEVEQVLSELATRELVHLLERQPGHKEPRWQQLVADEATPTQTVGSSGLGDRVADLEARVAKLEAALAELL